MCENADIIKMLPEPFRGALKSKESIYFDYKVDNKSDHTYLKERGYELCWGADCSCYIRGLNGFYPSSYGWGTFYFNKKDSKDNDKVFDLFCQMYKEGIIKLWRIGFYKENKKYDCVEQYNYEDGHWRKNDVFKGWIDCVNPFFSFDD